MGNKHTDILKFFVAGINYKKTNDLVRGSFAIGEEQYDKLLALALSHHLQELFVLSTCNRTEIYGFAENADQLIDLLCSQTPGSKETFTGLAYKKNGPAAIKHLFNVAAGLDSQILGDYEIVGQIKQAVRFAKEKNFIGSFLERLTNQVLQSSKLIKNQTALSDGTVSVSFAAVQYIRENIRQVADKDILVLGIGKIGRNTCKNLKDYLQTSRITLINRSITKAATLASELGLQYAPIDEIDGYIHKSDIILVATDASEPILLKSQVENGGAKLLIDLSIPFNVEKNASSLPGITLVTVDDLSKLKDETLQKREGEIPKANAIIRNSIKEFMEWHEMRRHVVVLKAVKIKLQEIRTCPLFVQTPLEKRTPSSDENIQRVINGMASKMRRQNQPGCNYIEAINEFMATGTN